MTTTTIIFVRHGETLWNNEGRYQGQQDSPLSPTGLLQADKVGEFLRKRHVDAVYSSDLKRAWLTAQSIAKHHGLDTIRDPRLREMSFGVWEGKTRDQVRQEYPELWDARGRDNLSTRVPGGEVPEEVVMRFREFLEEQVSKGMDQTIVVVSHGAALRFTLASLLHIPLDKSHCLHQSNAGVSELRYSGEGRDCLWEALCLNTTAHLV
jgi:alpha-ribazole phosphatase